MSPKGSKALNRKNSCLGLFQKKKKELTEMERKILEKEEILQDKKKELELKQEEYNQLFNNIKHKSNEVSIKRRKLKHQAELLESFDASTILCQSRISDRKRKIAFQLSTCVRKKQKLNPTTTSSSYRSKIVRRKETSDACSVVHGGSSLRADPVIEGMLDTVNSKFRTNKYQVLF